MDISAGAVVAYLTLDRSNFANGLKSAVGDLKTFADSTKSGTERVNALGSSMSTTGATLTKTVTTSLVGVGALATKTAIDFESAFTGVRKTVNASEEQFAQLETSIRDMSKSMPESASDIAKVAESAGQLGIKTENIEGFTKSMVMLGDTTNLSSDQAATSLARLANITGMPQENFQRLGSSIVELGNNMATTESDITEMSLRLAGAGHQVGMSEAQIVGLAGALSSVGIEAEAGGSAFSKVMVSMQLASETGSKANETIAKTGKSLRELQMMADADGKGFKSLAQSMGMTSDELKNLMSNSANLEAFSKVTGKTADQFSQSFKKDATGALLEFITGLQNCQKNGTSAIAVLDGMGITEVRMRDALLRASGAGDKFSKSIQLSTNAWEKNTALTKEAETRYGTTASQMAIMKNKLADLGITVGKIILPAFNDLIDKVSGVATWFGNLDEGTQKSIIKFGALAAATGPVLIILGKAGKLLSSIWGIGSKLVSIPSIFTKLNTEGTASGKVLGSLFSAFKKTETATTGAASAVKGMITPVGMASASIGELGLVARATSLLFSPWTIGLAAAGVAAYAYHSSQKVLNGTILDTKDNMSLMEKGMASLMGVQKYSRTELEKMGYVYANWNSGVSKETGKALDDLASKFRDLNLKISEVRMDKVISDGEAATITNKTNQLFDSVIQTIKSRSDETNSTLKNTFNYDGIIDEKEQNVINILSKGANEEISKITDGKAKINEILKKAAGEHRDLTTLEYAEISRIIQQAENGALDVIAKSEDEKLNAKATFLAKAKNLDLQGMSDLVKERAQSRDDELAKLDEFYDTSIAKLKLSLDGKSTEEQKAINDEIGKLQMEKDHRVQIQKDTFTDIIKLLQEKYPELASEINQYTGEILSEADKKAQEELNLTKEKYTTMDQITATGYHLVRNNITGALEGIYTVVDQSTGKIVGCWNQTTGEVSGYTAEQAQKCGELGMEYVAMKDVISQALQLQVGATINANNELVNSNGTVVGSLRDITNNSNGTRDALIDLNGRQYIVHVDSNGAVSAIRSVKGEMESLHDKVINVQVNWNSNGSTTRAGTEGYTGATEYATGTTNALNGQATVAENGPELIVSKSGFMNLATQRQSVNLEGGERVYNATQTKAILEKMNSKEQSSSSNSNMDNINIIISKLDKIANVFETLLNTDVKGEIVGKAVLEGEEVGEILYPFVANKLAMSAIERR
ncbi:phage tail tape measure protein [Clostridium sp. HBUAS56017]|uniref:phage tail tape measure protein n=1 Tax=Clostridium sp. HBUAS56017 TaxID=2571128 RepID=UPI001FA9C524|nr:phage tail tape measure protein [Clostridium sp. HBUAS56017]